jgi:phytoene dehydrogenase-like protein
MSDATVIIGGGLAGLACAVRLQRAGVDAIILEASDRLGGRCGSDRDGGLILDRGFQVYLDSYPEAGALLDLHKLDLRPFTAGALVRLGDRFWRFADPFREPSSALSTFLSPVASLGDKLRVAGLRRTLLNDALERPAAQNIPTIAYLRELGFSDQTIDRFFRPFYGGVFLERGLSTSSRMFEFTFRMFARGNATLPARGMQAIVDQLADRLRPKTVRLNAPVAAIDGSVVRLASGESITARAIVVATDVDVASRLLGEPMPRQGRWVGTTCVYFAADRSPIREPILALSSDASDIINHVSVVTDVCPEYATTGRSLVSCTALGIGHEKIEERAIEQLTRWYGPSVRKWTHVRTYEIPYALPEQSTETMTHVHHPVRLKPGLYVAGDHRDFASIDGAFASARRCAEAVIADA